jgi:hypothetical protein
MDENVNAKWQEFYRGWAPVELSKKFATLRARKEDVEEELSDINSELEYLAKVAIPETFTDQGLKNMNIDGVGRISLRADIYASVKSGMKETAYTWLSDIGAGDLIQDSVPPSTLKAFLKTRLKAGEDIPEDLFNVTPYQQATLTKG